MDVKGYEVKGVQVDPQTRCAHYHSEVDIIAIKFKCCGTYFPCYECHDENTNHEVEQWGIDERDEKAILCGHCGTELTISEYLQSQSTCPYCDAQFNPGCRFHYHMYFK